VAQKYTNGIELKYLSTKIIRLQLSLEGADFRRRLQGQLTQVTPRRSERQNIVDSANGCPDNRKRSARSRGPIALEQVIGDNAVEIWVLIEAPKEVGGIR